METAQLSIDGFLTKIRREVIDLYQFEHATQAVIIEIETKIYQLAEENNIHLKSKPKFEMFHDRQVIKLSFDTERVFMEVYPEQELRVRTHDV